MKNFLLSIVVMILLTSTAYAEIKTYTSVGEYLMTNETIDFAKKQAEVEAQSKILEEVCIDVRKTATMTDHELDEEEIITISESVLHVTDTKFSMDMDEEGILIKAHVTANIDTEELATLLAQ